MDTIDALNTRYACRSFDHRPVEEETILKILTAATRAPSWANSQPWEIFVATGMPLERLRKAYLANYKKSEPRNPDIAAPQQWPPAMKQRIDESFKPRTSMPEEMREKLNERNFLLFDAPVIVYICLDRAAPSWSLFDLGSLAQSIMLAAVDFDLQSIPAIMLVTYPDLIRAELKIPDNYLIAIGIAIGYSNPREKTPSRSIRRPLEEAVTLIGF